ncbi:MAG: hypothetical protein EOO46_23840 [Flavobacterium sp.]|nr:MAG: hypothetical protein EOO46_23840 [Flavobacterium sp.]
MVYICPECNNSNKDLIREIDFLNYIEALLEQNVEFSETKRDVLIGNNTKWRIDIFTKDRGTELFLEISAYTFLDAPRIYDLVNELTIYQKEIHNSNLAIAVLCVVSEDTKRYFAQKQIAVWDIDYISKRFGKEIIKLKHPIFTKLFIANLDKKPEIKLVKKLELIKPGRAEWSLYQKLMNEILTTLFCPPLDNPHYEITDDFKINRRDFIIPNYCESGFWAYMRDQYSADFIIIDAKNYSKKVQKRDVLQVSNYLKKHGAGLFGIIISRTEQDLSASLTIREVWAIQRKLIIGHFQERF